MNNYAENDIDKLNEFLQNEISAVETYNQCIEKSSGSGTLNSLVELQQSHAERARLLRERILALGGTPAEGSGMWGSFAKLVEGGAKAFGEQAALAALEEGEDKGLRDYRDESEDLSATTRQFVMSTLLPAQQRSHDTMSRLKHR